MPIGRRLALRRGSGGPDEGTLAWLIARHRETTTWASLSAGTRRQRENIFKQVIETAGTQPAAKINTAIIVAGRERRARTPPKPRLTARHAPNSARILILGPLAARTYQTALPWRVTSSCKRGGRGRGIISITGQFPHPVQVAYRCPVDCRLFRI